MGHSLPLKDGADSSNGHPSPQAWVLCPNSLGSDPWGPLMEQTPLTDSFYVDEGRCHVLSESSPPMG